MRSENEKKPVAGETMVSEHTTSGLRWYGYFLMALLTLAIFYLDFASYYAWTAAAERYQWLPLTHAILSHITTIIVWVAGSWLIVKALKHKWGADLFAPQPSPSRIGVALSILCVIVMTALLWLMNGGVKPLLEWSGAIRRLGSYGWIDFILQNIYYVFEMLVAFLMCALGQRAGELLTGNKRIPWGAIVLGLFWGSLHIFSKNYVVGLFSIGLGFLLGLPYLLLNRNAKLTWLFMFLMFVL